MLPMVRPASAQPAARHNLQTHSKRRMAVSVKLAARGSTRSPNAGYPTWSVESACRLERAMSVHDVSGALSPLRTRAAEDLEDGHTYEWHETRQPGLVSDSYGDDRGGDEDTQVVSSFMMVQLLQELKKRRSVAAALLVRTRP